MPPTPAAFVLSERAFSEVYGPEALQSLQPAIRLLSPPATASSVQASPPAWLAETEVLFTGWGGPRLDRALLDRMPRLRAVFYGGGTPRPVVSDALWERGILVSSAAAMNAVSVAEYTFGAILLSFKRAWHHARLTRAQRSYVPTVPLPVASGRGACVGLVSLGLVGSRVAERLRACDVDVVAYDPRQQPARFAELGVRAVTLEHLFSVSDIVSLHAPHRPETTGLVDARLLARLKPNATLINTARGALIRSAALVEFLGARPDVQALLDVADPEPPEAASPLYDLPNVFLTPHIAGAIGPERRRLGRAMVEEFLRFRRGEPLRYGVTAEQLAVSA